MPTRVFRPDVAIEAPCRPPSFRIARALLLVVLLLSVAPSYAKPKGDEKPESKRQGQSGQAAPEASKGANPTAAAEKAPAKRRPRKPPTLADTSSVATAALQTWRCKWLRGEDADTGIALPTRTDSVLFELNLHKSMVNWQGLLASDVVVSDSLIQWRLPSGPAYYQLDRYSLEVYRRQSDFRGHLVVTEVFQCAVAGKRAL